MKLPPTNRHIFRLIAVLFATMLCCIGEVRAVIGGSVVQYDPLSQGVFGVLPATTTYTLNVTAPTALSTLPVTVTLRVVSTQVPLGDNATALNYVRLSTNTLTFTAAGQKLPVTVTVDLPLSALSNDVTAGAYTYKIYTDGWPAGVTDGGATINASVTLPTTPTGNPPTVSITTPADGTVFTYPVTGFPAQIPFTFDAATDSSSPVITAVAANFGDATGMAPVAVTTSGLGGAAVTGSGQFTVLAPGTYSLQVSATNPIGSETDTNTYIVKVSAPPPVVTIASPSVGATYTYRAGDPATMVTFSFTAVSAFGGIRTLTAQIDGANIVFVPTGIGSLTATGTVMLPYTTAGAHTVSVTATDDNGTASAQSNFTVNVIAPTPTIDITTPASPQTFTLPVGGTTMNVPYSFKSTSNNGFVVNSVTASLGSTGLTPTTVGLGTASAVSSGTLTNLGVGTYTLTATATSAGITVQDTATFTIVGSTLPPSVVINTPPVGSTYTRVSGGPSVSIPLTFTGTSNTVGGVITNLTAALDGVPVTVTKTNIGQKVATGAATLSVTSAGTHTISVTAIDAYGTANATRTFVLNVVQGRTVCGEVFFDVDFDGREDCAEFGLSGVTVKLVDASNQVVSTDVTDCGGSYAFSNIGPGTYTVVPVAPAGLSLTTPTRTVTVAGCNACVSDIGYGLNFRALQSMTAGGYTIGYWKNNLDKAIAGKTAGTQVSKANLITYTDKIGCFALAPFDDITMKTASSTMGSTSSKSTDLLAKQLIASEYNYQNGAYLNGNKTLTFLFLYWGEYVLSHPANYSSTYIIWAKDWFDAYNNSHGGVVAGPSP